MQERSGEGYALLPALSAASPSRIARSFPDQKQAYTPSHEEWLEWGARMDHASARATSSASTLHPALFLSGDAAISHRTVDPLPTIYSSRGVPRCSQRTRVHEQVAYAKWQKKEQNHIALRATEKARASAKHKLRRAARDLAEKDHCTRRKADKDFQEKKAATAIQARSRGRAARDEVQGQIAAAEKIQAGHRGLKIRNQIRHQSAAVVKLQNLIRHRLAWLLVYKLKAGKRYHDASRSSVVWNSFVKKVEATVPLSK